MAEVTRAELTPEEQAIWDAIVKTPRYLDVATKEIVPRVQEVVLDTIKAAKAKWAMSFAGYYPSGDEIGLGDIRVHMLGGSDTWRQNYTAARWQDWIAVDKEISDDLYIVVWEWENLEGVPHSTDLYINAGGVKLPILDLTKLWNHPEARIPMPDPLVLTPETVLDTDVRIDDANVWDHLKPIGIVVGKGNRLQMKAYY